MNPAEIDLGSPSDKISKNEKNTLEALVLKSRQFLDKKIVEKQNVIFFK